MNIQITYSWLNLEEKGVEVRWAPTKFGQVFVEDIEPLMDNKTRAISVSSVTCLPGSRNDIESIGKLCKEREIYLIVDAVQSMGLLNFDVKKLGVDMFATSAHKGLNVLHGVGIFFCREEIIPEIKPTFISKSSIANANGQQDALEYKLTFLDTAEKFEIGNLNYSGIIALNESVKYLNSIGINAIEKRILELSELLTEGLKQVGANVLSSTDKKYQSSIVSFKTKNTGTLHKQLLDNKVITAYPYRRDTIRASTNIYNNEEDIERLIKLVKELDK